MCSHLTEKISRAIGARLLLQFNYKGEVCIVEPYMVGKNQHGMDCLRAWRIEAPEDTVSKTSWCSFDFSDINNLKTLSKSFHSIRPGYDPYDSSMKHIYYRM
jgi:hypothetical protein